MSKIPVSPGNDCAFIVPLHKLEVADGKAKFVAFTDDDGTAKAYIAIGDKTTDAAAHVTLEVTLTYLSKEWWLVKFEGSILVAATMETAIGNRDIWIHVYTDAAPDIHRAYPAEYVRNPTGKVETV